MGDRKADFDEITVRRINVVDENGSIRLAIHNKARTPPPTERAFAGITFFDEDGRENGALLISETPTLKFDQYKGDEVVKLENIDDGDKVVVRGLTVSDRPQNEEEYTTKFTEEHGRRPHWREIEKPRAFIGRSINGEAKVSLGDSKGRERIRMLIDQHDVPRIEVLDANGEVIYSLPPEAPRLKLPPTGGLPKWIVFTPAHVLNMVGQDFDLALKWAEQFEDPIRSSWREWLLTAKRMNMGPMKDDHGNGADCNNVSTK